MRKLFLKTIRLAAMAWCGIPACALASSGGGEAIVFVADSRRLTGWQAWCTNLYNENLLYFALLTAITIPTLALILGSIMSFILSRTGINLKARVLAEH